MEILKGFSSQIWILIIISFLICLSTHLLIQKLKIKNFSITEVFLGIYICLQPFINCGDCRKPFNLIYLFWLISIFPLVELFKNDLSANLIAMKKTKIETIKELIESNNKVFAYTQSSVSIFTLNPNNFSLKENFYILSNKTLSFLNSIKQKLMFSNY
jgi:hypothetical protein